MTDQFLLEWKELNIRVRAKLLRDKAPLFCDAFEKLLPFESIQGHTVVSGHNMSVPIKLLWLEREYPAERAPGNLFIYTNGQRMVIPYGATTEPGLVNTFAQIFPEDLPLLESVGEASKSRLMSGITEPQRVTVTALT